MKINSNDFMFNLQEGEEIKRFTGGGLPNAKEDNFIPFSYLGNRNQIRVNFTPSALGVYDMKLFSSNRQGYSDRGNNSNIEIAR